MVVADKRPRRIIVMLVSRATSSCEAAVLVCLVAPHQIDHKKEQAIKRYLGACCYGAIFGQFAVVLAE